MNNPISELREALKTVLDGECGYYAEEAPDEAIYPYRVGKLTASYDEAGSTSELWTYELDYWTAGKSYMALYDQERADRGDGDLINPSGLDRMRLSLPHGYAYVMHDNLIPIDDPDRFLRRLRSSYTIRIINAKE